MFSLTESSIFVKEEFRSPDALSVLKEAFRQSVAFSVHPPMLVQNQETWSYYVFSNCLNKMFTVFI